MGAADENPPRERRSSGLVSGILMVFGLVLVGGLIFGFGEGPPEPPTRAVADRYVAETAGVRDKIKKALHIRFPDHKQALTERFVAFDQWALKPGTPQQQVDRSLFIQEMIRAWIKDGGRKLAKLKVERVLDDINRAIAAGDQGESKSSESRSDSSTSGAPK